MAIIKLLNSFYIAEQPWLLMENFVLFLENKIVGFIVGGIKGVYLGIDKGLMIVMQTKIGQIDMILSYLFIS